MRKEGLTLLEILVAMLILALVMIGIVNVFIAGRRHLGHSRAKIQAAQLGRLFLAPLQNQVRQDQWGSNCLSSNPTIGCPAEETLGPITYTPVYDISDGPINNLRKVKVTITWNETPPQ